MTFPPRHIGDLASQDRPQPGLSLTFRLGTALVPVLMGLEHRLLHQVGRVGQAPMASVQVQSRQKQQVAAILLHLGLVVVGVWSHDHSPSYPDASRRRTEPRWAGKRVCPCQPAPVIGPTSRSETF